MKKLVIPLIIIIVLAAFFTTDLIRANNNTAPLFAIRVAQLKDGGTCEYLGFGYKVIKYKTMGGRKDTEIGTWFLENDATLKTLPLSVKLPLDKYSPLMSSVPGLPVEVEGTIQATIQIKVNAGEIILWGADTESKVISRGKEYSITLMESEKFTFYWSPLNDQASNAEVTINSTYNDLTAKPIHLKISSKDSMYSAEIIK